MAEVTAMRNNALPYPVYGLPYVIVFPMLDADGDFVTGATTPDAEISKNGDTFADCTNESTEIATNSGVYYLSLTGTELTTDVATIQAKSATAGMKTTLAVLYPRKLVTIRSGTTQGGSSTTIQFDSSASPVDDYYNGMVVSASLDGTTEVRLITDYTGSTKTATVHVAWISGDPGPDSNDTFVIYRPDGTQLVQADTSVWNGTAVATPATAGIPDVNAKNVNNVATTSVTTINANLGTTQPENFTGTGASALVKVDMVDLAGAATAVTNLNTIFNTDYATIYDTTNKAFLAKLGNFAMGGSSLALTTGAIACTTITASGAVAFQSTFAVTGTTTLTGAVTASNASNNIVGIDVAKIAGTAYASSELHTLASHDPGATIGTSTLTQTQVTGGAYALSSASFSFNTALDFTSTQKTSLNAATPASVQNISAQTGDSYARLGAPAGASVSADVAAIKSDTGTILTDVNSGAGAIYTRIGAPAGASIAADIAAVNSKTTNLPASPAAVGSAMTLADGAITDAKITLPSLSGPATGALGMIYQLWRRWFKKATLNKTTGDEVTYADDGSTPVTTATVTDDGTTQTRGAAA